MTADVRGGLIPQLTGWSPFFQPPLYCPMHEAIAKDDGAG